jgi:transposase
MGKRERQRRSFTPEFKAEAVKVVQQSGKSIAMVARELDLTETALRGAAGGGRCRAGTRRRAHDGRADRVGSSGARGGRCARNATS